MAKDLIHDAVKKALIKDGWTINTMGWDDERHVRYTQLYIRLQNHKIWIEEDWTEEGIATYFLEHRMPRQDIYSASNTRRCGPTRNLP